VENEDEGCWPAATVAERPIWVIAQSVLAMAAFSVVLPPGRTPTVQWQRCLSVFRFICAASLRR